MNERIKQVRKYYGLTQNEFGERIGVRGNTITGYENGLRSPSNAIIIAIAKEYNINESWLRTGEGDMLNEDVASRRKEETIGERLRILRLSLRLTQEQLGESIGVKGNTIAQWESGRNAIPESVIRLICNQYQISKDWLQTGEGEMPNDGEVKTPGERLRILRARFSLTQRELADRIRVKRNTVGQWECGINAMTDQMIFLICKEFCVNEDWLRTGDGNMLAYDSAPEIGERVKQTRFSLDLTQAKFGAGIGLKQNSTALIERGDRALTKQLATSISREFGVDRGWLLSGAGESHVPDDDRLDSLIVSLNEQILGLDRGKAILAVEIMQRLLLLLK